MYFLSPLFFTLMKGKKGYLNWCVLFILSLVIIEYVKKDLLSDTEFLHYQWITQVPAYLLGMLVGKLKEINQNVVTASIFCIILAIPVISTFLTIINKFLFLPSILSRLSYLVLFSYLFTYLKNINNNATKTFLVVLQYLGKYSLELYMLHMLLYGFFKTLYLIPPTANILLSIVIALLFCSVAQKASSKVIQCISTKI